MATTTNYSWTTPDDTDLVKDGAAAIRTLGSSVDTTVKNLNPETTLGDIAYRSSTANVKTRLGLGTAGQVLTVNSGANAPEWATLPAAGGMTLINTGGTTLTGASITLSSIPATYKNLQLIVRNYLPSVDNEVLDMRFNGDSANRYKDLATSNSAQSFDQPAIQLSAGNDNAVGSGLIVSTIFDYANTVSWKMETHFCLTVNSTTTTQMNYRVLSGFYNQTTAINSITIKPSTGNFTSGTVFLYGVS